MASRQGLAVVALMLVLGAAGETLAQTTSGTQRPQPPRGILPPQQPSQPPPAPPSVPPASPSPAPAAVPTPVPSSGAATSPTAAAPAREVAPPEAVLGAPVYPGAVFLGSFDAGLGQRYYLFGLDTPYAQVVTYYRNVLKSRGTEVFDAPPVWTFELGRFRQETMAFPPSVTVRDHAAGGQSGYPHADGTTLRRFATVIQIVPPPPGAGRR